MYLKSKIHIIASIITKIATVESSLFEESIQKQEKEKREKNYTHFCLK